MTHFALHATDRQSDLRITTNTVRPGCHVVGLCKSAVTPENRRVSQLYELYNDPRESKRKRSRKTGITGRRKINLHLSIRNVVYWLDLRVVYLSSSHTSDEEQERKIIGKVIPIGVAVITIIVFGWLALQLLIQLPW